MNSQARSTSVSRRRVLQVGGFLAAGGLLDLGVGPEGRTTPHGLLWGRETAAGLKYHTQVPPNAEPPLERLIESHVTPDKWFYVRSHAASPQLDAETFQLAVEGLVHRPLAMTVGELRNRFPGREVMCTMTCAGNRRTEHSRIKPVGGVPWESGAIGNATWSGVSLADVLRHAELQPDARHVWFEGADQVDHSGGIIPFGGSIPLRKALALEDSLPGGLIAFLMNGQPLTADHGFPMRTVVPGYIGARSVKWLRKIIVSQHPSPNHYLAGAYKLVTEDLPRQWDTSEPLYEYVTNSVICRPSAGQSLPAGPAVVEGYALAGGQPGNRLTAVEVSRDGGRVWYPARFVDPHRPFCWRRWAIELPLAPDCRELIVRATDSQGFTQPEQMAWNLKGYQFNAWHRVPLQVRG